MNNNKSILSYKKIYFSGIGGVSCSALAKYSILSGKSVFGSDICKNNYTINLQKFGAKISYNQNGNLLKKDFAFVYSSAIKEDSEEFIKAKKLSLPIFKRSEMLGVICSKIKNSIAISGSHGKTTTSAIISKILIDAKLEPTIFIGGETKDICNFEYGSNDYCVIEACEYKKNFLNIIPKISVVLNIDNDHLDSYQNVDEEIECFNKFISQSLAIVNSDDKNCKNLSSSAMITFGIDNLANFMAKKIKKEINGYSFCFYKGSENIGRISLKIAGKHNIYNALAGIVVADYLKIPFSVVKNSIEQFNGVKRRNEFLGKYKNKSIICDYAHHPTEINALYEMYEKENKKTLFVFQPHTYSRTQILMKDFVNSLRKFDNLIIYKTYPARESFNINGSAETLYNNVLTRKNLCKKVCFSQSETLLKTIVDSKFNKVQKIIFVGAGDIYNIAQNFCKKTNKHLQNNKKYCKIYANLY